MLLREKVNILPARRNYQPLPSLMFFLNLLPGMWMQETPCFIYEEFYGFKSSVAFNQLFSSPEFLFV
jgi:hypothetical protein